MSNKPSEEGLSAAALRNVVRERAADYCEYCRSSADYSPGDFAIEHIVPRAKGGTDNLENLAYSCQGCNSRKFTATEAIDPVTGNRATLYHPRQDSWGTHFLWSEDRLYIIGQTPTGRATVERLQLNRVGVVNIRRGQLLLGMHPAQKT
jgi:hypothetical protein